MPRTRVYEAVTERLEILDTEGRVDDALMPEIDTSRIRDLYRDMVLMRTFDEKALKLQRQGRMGTWPPIKGQEAVQASRLRILGGRRARLVFSRGRALLSGGCPGGQPVAARCRRWVVAQTSWRGCGGGDLRRRRLDLGG